MALGICWTSGRTSWLGRYCGRLVDISLVSFKQTAICELSDILNVFDSFLPPVTYLPGGNCVYREQAPLFMQAGGLRAQRETSPHLLPTCLSSASRLCCATDGEERGCSIHVLTLGEALVLQHPLLF